MNGPIDPRTGRAKLGGRAITANAEHLRQLRWRSLVPVELPFGYVTHLAVFTQLRTVLLCHRDVTAAVPATSSWRRLCRDCVRARDGWLATEVPS